MKPIAEKTARLAGRDRRSDLALLKVEGGTYPFVSFATRARPRGDSRPVGR